LANSSPTCRARPATTNGRRRLSAAIEWLLDVFVGDWPGFSDDVLLIDSVPLERDTSRETVEHRFAALSRRRIRRGTFCSVSELTPAAEEHIALNNTHCQAVRAAHQRRPHAGQGRAS
jgi:hypothetical protein